MANIKKLLFLACGVSLCFFTLLCASCKSELSLPTYELKLDYADGVLSGNLRYKFVNDQNDNLNNVKFYLRANAYLSILAQNAPQQTNYSNAYYDGESFGKTDILSVFINGEKVR